MGGFSTLLEGFSPRRFWGTRPAGARDAMQAWGARAHLDRQLILGCGRHRQPRQLHQALPPDAPVLCRGLRCAAAWKPGQPSARRPSRGQRRGAPSPNAALSAPGALLASCFGAAGVHAVNTQRGAQHSLQLLSCWRVACAPRCHPCDFHSPRAGRTESGAERRVCNGSTTENSRRRLSACLQRPKMQKTAPLTASSTSLGRRRARQLAHHCQGVHGTATHAARARQHGQHCHAAWHDGAARSAALPAHAPFTGGRSARGGGW